ncbi:MAG: hypothetical protein D6722_02625 [Bacteroidetes bacterium]|nr:MAG: hypothetical protein D6722_02625 [Bacteroidota bacterium]
MHLCLLPLLLVLGLALLRPESDGPTEPEVTPLSCAKGESIRLTGELAQGQPMPLDWAASSQVACFPATRFAEFEGHHQLYRVDLPRYSRIRIRVVPEGRHRINVYGLRQGTHPSMQAVPPAISVAGSCEASYPIYAGEPDLSRGGEPQEIEFIAINNPYSILIGVAGARGVTAGAYTLEVSIGDR